MSKLYTVKGFIILSLFMISYMSFSQQDPQFSQYFFNNFYTNPAYAGVNKKIEALLGYRVQWAGYTPTVTTDGSGPTTQIISLNTPLYIKKINLGVGGYFLNDMLGLQENKEINLSWAYHHSIKDHTLSIGFNTSFNRESIDNSKLRARDENDPIIDALANQSNPYVFDIGVGLYFNSDRFYGSVSAMHLLEPSSYPNIEEINNKLRRHFYFTGGTRIPISSSVDIMASGIMKTDLNSYSFELSGIAVYNNKIYGGISFREIESVILITGLEPFKNLGVRLSYSIDFTITEISSKSLTSHEIMLAYGFPLAPAKRIKIRTPRFIHE